MALVFVGGIYEWWEDRRLSRRFRGSVIPNAPFAGYSGADLRLARGVERGEVDGGDGGDGGSKSCANTLGVCVLGCGTLGVGTLGVIGVCGGCSAGEKRYLADGGVRT